jgi:ankyrin repeat protein
MKLKFQITALFALLNISAAAAISDAQLYQTVRTGSPAAFRQLLDSGVAINHQDSAGNSLLMHAVLYGNADTVKLLLERGADANATNNAGATPLLRAAGNHDKIKLLIKHGANVNARSALGNTPLLVAARARGSAKSVELLLKHGAEINATNNFGATALMAAAASGELDTVRLLVKRGADVNVHVHGSEAAAIWGGGRSALMWAAFRGDHAMARFLLDSGADINSSEGFGTALIQAAWNDQTEMAKYLLKRNANPNQADFMADFTPLHWAAGSERSNPDLVNALLKHGANPNAEGGAPVDAFMGIPQTPLLIARKRNYDSITTTLLAAGANDKPAKSVPAVEPRPTEISDQALRAALRAAIPPLEETATFSKGAYLRHSSKQDCVSCHQQYIPLTTFAFAKSVAAPVNTTRESEVLEMVRRDNTNLFEITAQTTFHPEPAHGYGYALLALAAQNEPPSPEIDVMIHHLLIVQGRDGQWHNNLPRPPIQSSDFGATALAVHALKKYPLPARQAEIDQRIARARKWLINAKPLNAEERAYQLLGLAWAGESPSKLHTFAQQLVATQRRNGGWAQLDTLESDAYATGLSLFALAQATCTDSPAFQRGLQFLLGTQASDGTWHVRARAYPFQPTMRSGYPYSRDSWISATGASWAAIAISLALEDRPVEITARVR